MDYFQFALTSISEIFFSEIDDYSNKIFSVRNSVQVKNILPTPHGNQTEEQFIGSCMANEKMQSEFPDHKQRAAVCYSQWGEEKNSASNAGRVDLQKIRTSEFVAPVIRAGVLYYKPGELQGGSTMSSEGARVYYHPDSLKDEEFLNTVKRSAINIGTHEANTSEYNRSADGWIVDAWYDDNLKAVMARGVVHGAENVKYVEQNKGRPEFGTSAYIDFLGVKKEKGTAPNGEEYDAVTTKLINNHLAILPNIRDKKNVILAFNALKEETNSNIIEGKNSKENNMSIDKEALKNALEDLEKEKAENASYDEMRNSIKNTGERLEKLESMMAKMAKNGEAEEKKEEPKAENAKNEDDDRKEEKSENAKDEDSFNAKNAKPSQETIKDFGEYFGVSWDSTPSFMSLAKLAGASVSTIEEAISAVNAKRKDIKKEYDSYVSYGNAEKSTSSFDEFLKSA